MDVNLLVFLSLMALALVRNYVAFLIIGARIAEIHEAAGRAINSGDQDKFYRILGLYEQMSHCRVMFDLTAWRLRHAFPPIEA